MTFWPPLGSVSEEDDRRTWFPLSGEQRSEVGIGGHYHACFDHGSRENLLIGGSLHGVVANMDGVAADRRRPSATTGERALSIRNLTPRS